MSATAVVPFAATESAPPDAPPSRWLPLEVTLRIFVWAVALCACVTPLAVLLGALYSGEVDSLRARGVVVTNQGQVDATQSTTSRVEVVILVVLTMAVVQSVIFLSVDRGLGVRLGRAVRGTFVVYSVVLTALVISDNEGAGSALFAFACYVVSSRGVAKDTGQPKIGWLLFWLQLALVLLSVVYQIVMERFFAQHVSEGERVVVLALLPWACDLAAAPSRLLACCSLDMQQPSSLGVAPAVVVLMVQHLLVRTLMFAVTSSRGTLLAIAGVALNETLVRKTALWRDHALARAGGLPTVPLARRRESLAMFLAADSVSEVWATLSTMVMYLVFRIGPDREAPAASALVLSGLSQVGAELLNDAAVPLYSVLRGHARFQEMKLDVLRRPGRWLHVYMVAISFISFWGAVLYLCNPHVPERALCAWSKDEHSHWWHFSYCSRTEEWASVGEG